MRHSTWAALVLHALERATQAVYGGVGLAAVAQEVGVDDPTWYDFAKQEGLPRAPMTAMEDLVEAAPEAEDADLAGATFGPGDPGWDDEPNAQPTWFVEPAERIGVPPT